MIVPAEYSVPVAAWGVRGKVTGIFTRQMTAVEQDGRSIHLTPVLKFPTVDKIHIRKVPIVDIII